MTLVKDELGRGTASPITSVDIERLALRIGCHPADLEAISEVETNGRGWFPDGRLKILFEKHWFYKFLNKKERVKAAQKQLVSPHWENDYDDQVTANERYTLLGEAIDINQSAALKSTSMGRYQIMGFNYEICGFSSPLDMWQKFCQSEKYQLQALERFLKSKGLFEALRARDFQKIETKYNGGGLDGLYAKRMETKSTKLRHTRWKNWDAKGAADRLKRFDQERKIEVNTSSPEGNKPAVAFVTLVTGVFAAASATIATYWEEFQAWLGGLF